MSIQHDVFDNAIDHFSAEEEEIRTAAAFAAGKCNMITVAVSSTDGKQREHCDWEPAFVSPCHPQSCGAGPIQEVVISPRSERSWLQASLRVGHSLKISFSTGCNSLLSRTIGACCRRYMDSPFPQLHFRLGRIDTKCCCSVPGKTHNHTAVTLPSPTPCRYTR